MVRETLWIGGTPIRATSGAANTAVLLASFNAAALALRPFTIIRMRGTISCFSDQVAASENMEIAYGAAVVSDQAVAIGVTAVPTPFTDSDSDLWFMYETILTRFILLSSVGFDHMLPERIVDSKGMRKVEQGQDLVLVQESGSGSSGVILNSYIRTLVKLH